MIGRQAPIGKGIGCIEAHLLACAALGRSRLRTRGERRAAAARALDLAAAEAS